MTREKFDEQFSQAVTGVREHTLSHCFNRLPEENRFIIKPNGKDVHPGLNNGEATILKELNAYSNKLLTADKVSWLLARSGRVPLWINISVYETTKKYTVIELLTSRRFREEKELFLKVDKFAPFHQLVMFPPHSLRIEKDGKFDLNFRRKQEFLLQRRTLAWRIKKLFNGF